MEDLYIRFLVAIILIGCIVAILPWWVFLIILAPILYAAFKIWWKLRQIKKMANGQDNPFGQGNPFGSGNPFGQQSTQQHTTKTTSSPKHEKKVFNDDEGEYVEFEEVK